MKVVYYQDKKGNFGDELNKWLWPKLLDNFISGFCHHGIEFYESNDQESLLFYGIGTLIDERIPKKPKKIIFGSGYGYNTPPQIDNTFKIFFVRGEKTAEALALSPELAITDSAILLRNFYPAATEVDKKFPISLMPHIDSEVDDYWPNACQKLGIHYISPSGFNIENTIDELIQSEYLITEAMHGAIVADALRIPWLPISSAHHVNNFKWEDWCKSMRLSYQPYHIIPIYKNTKQSLLKEKMNQVKLLIRQRQLSKLINKNKSYFLSDEETLNSHLIKMNEKLEDLKSYLNLHLKSDIL